MTSSGVGADFFQRLSALSEQFAASLPQTLGRLADARARIDPDHPQTALVAEVHAVLHTLAGSAATFGFRELGQQARALEQRLRVFTTFDAVAPEDWEDWLVRMDTFTVWGLRDPKSPYPSDESAV